MCPLPGLPQIPAAGSTWAPHCVWPGGRRAWGPADRCRAPPLPTTSLLPSHRVLVVPTAASALDGGGHGGEQPLGPPAAPLGTVRPGREAEALTAPPHPLPQVRAFLQPPLKGVVLETFGSGNGPSKPDLLRELRAAAERGVLILNCTHCLRGSVSPRYAASMVGRGARPGGAGAGPGAQGRPAWEPAPHLPPTAPPSRRRPEPASCPAST